MGTRESAGIPTHQLTRAPLAAAPPIRYSFAMTTALEQHEHDLEHLVQIARDGEDVVLTSNGQAVAKITALTPSVPAPITNLRIGEGLQPGISPPAAASQSKKAPPGVIKDWIEKAAAAAAASATGKKGATTDEIIEDLRSDRF